MKRKDAEKLTFSGAMAACEELGIVPPLNRAEMIALLCAEEPEEEEPAEGK